MFYEILALKEILRNMDGSDYVSGSDDQSDSDDSSYKLVTTSHLVAARNVPEDKDACKVTVLPSGSKGSDVPQQHLKGKTGTSSSPNVLESRPRYEISFESEEENDRITIGAWLDDNHLHTAMQLMKRQFPEVAGLESVLLPQRRGFSVDSDVTKLWVQPMINGHMHWVTVARLPNTHTILLLDSLHTKYPILKTGKVSGLLTPTLEASITMAQRFSSVHTVRIPDVQQQRNVSDCGVFAIANALAVCNGWDVTTQLNYKVQVMRRHLRDCFEDRKMLPFPIVDDLTHLPFTRIREKSFNVVCICKLPEHVDGMVSCSVCTMQYHYRCAEKQGYVRNKN